MSPRGLQLYQICWCDAFWCTECTETLPKIQKTREKIYEKKQKYIENANMKVKSMEMRNVCQSYVFLSQKLPFGNKHERKTKLEHNPIPWYQTTMVTMHHPGMTNACCCKMCMRCMHLQKKNHSERYKGSLEFISMNDSCDVRKCDGMFATGT